tara:strand:+ start:173 stop:577 length:405 start_codon:yes stop_codon:yes gene_type:complete
MRYKLWFRFIILLNDTACDIGIDRKYHMPYCIYTDYSHEELKSAGISTVNRGTTYFENLAAHNSDEHLNMSHTLFTPFFPESDDEEDEMRQSPQTGCDDEADERDDEEDESTQVASLDAERLWNLDKNDVSDVI